MAFRTRHAHAIDPLSEEQLLGGARSRWSRTVTTSCKRGFTLIPRVTPSAPQGQHRSRYLVKMAHSAVLQMAAFARNGEWKGTRVGFGVLWREEGGPGLCFFRSGQGFRRASNIPAARGCGASDKPRVREIEALNGRAFEIDVEGRHDVLMLRQCPRSARVG